MSMRLSFLAALTALGLAAPASAHEMFLKPDRARVRAGSDQTIRLINGSFEESENSIERERMQNVSIVARGLTRHPPESAWSDDAQQTTSYLNYRAGEAGTYVIGVSTKPTILTLPAKDWAEYLKHDGVVDTLATFEKENKLAQIRERYSKHVRAIVQVGDAKTNDYTKPLGYPVEILFDQNPYDLKPGAELSFRVLFKGEPVVNQFVKASYEGHHDHDTSGTHVSAYELRTDQNGRAKFVPNKPALWYVSLIHMSKISDPDADYESNWATATFGVE